MNNLKLNDFGYYLAGLIEGDGYLNINNRNILSIGITFNMKDQPLALKLIALLGQGYLGQGYLGQGYGHIVKRKGQNIELRFTNKKSLLQIINLIKGKFRTPKIDQLNKAIEFMNKHYSISLAINPIDVSPIYKNSWLAGFIEANGNFYIRYSDKQIICKFSLEQRMIYSKTLESYENILLSICSYFKVKLVQRYRQSINKSYYIIRIENQNSIKLLIDYLNKFNLYSSKYLDYLLWKQAFEIILLKNHYSKSGSLAVKKLKNRMNNSRTEFNWDHLNNLDV